MRKEEPRNEDASDGDEREGRRVRRARNAGIVLVATFAPESRVHRTRRSRVSLQSRPARPAVVSTLTPRRRGVLTPRRRGVLTPPRVSSILSVGGQLVLAFLCFPSPLDASRFPSSAPRKSTTRLLASYPCGANTSPCANPSTHNTSAASRANKCVAIASGSRMASLECITASARAGMSSAHAHTPNHQNCRRSVTAHESSRVMHQSRASVKANRDTNPARSRHDDAKSPRGRRRAPPRDPRRRRAWRRSPTPAAGGDQPPHLPPPVLELIQHLGDDRGEHQTRGDRIHEYRGGDSCARWHARATTNVPNGVPRGTVFASRVDDTNLHRVHELVRGQRAVHRAQGNLGKAHERDGTVRTRAEDVRDGPQVRRKTDAEAVRRRNRRRRSVARRRRRPRGRGRIAGRKRRGRRHTPAETRTRVIRAIAVAAASTKHVERTAKESAARRGRAAIATPRTEIILQRRRVGRFLGRYRWGARGTTRTYAASDGVALVDGFVVGGGKPRIDARVLRDGGGGVASSDPVGDPGVVARAVSEAPTPEDHPGERFGAVGVGDHEERLAQRLEGSA